MGTKWNSRLFYWIAEEVLKHPEVKIFPRYLNILRWILRPLNSFKWYLNSNDNLFRYDMQHDTFIIYGVRYSDKLFRTMSTEGANIGAVVQIIKREDGTITLREIRDYSPNIDYKCVTQNK